MKKSPHAFPLLFYGLLLAVLLATAVYLREAEPEVSPVYSDIVDLFETQQVDAFRVDEQGRLILQLKTPFQGESRLVYALADPEAFRQELGPMIRQQHADGVLKSYEIEPLRQRTSTLFLLVCLLSFAGIGLCLFTLLRSGNRGGNGSLMQFTRAKTQTGGGDPVTFADVAGAQEEKQELEEIVQFLKDPEAFTALGARIPKGVLLVGPPGTGKTLLARAVAGEAGGQFFSISGSDFVELFVGVGAGRVRDLFAQAKRSAPAIIFIDEIDAVGRRRGAGLGGGHDEREQTLNQLLVEMDGFQQNENIVVMAATNRPDILDSALLRPGRFDRQVYVGLPDSGGREEILRLHARKKPLSDDVDLAAIAKMTAGFTGADLANLLNEAALAAARAGRSALTMADLQASMIKVLAGPEKPSRRISQHERQLTACHEAGHAVVMHCLPTHDPVHQITIIPRGAAGGMTISLPGEDRHFISRREMTESIVAFLGGRAAEQLILDDVSTGASDDLRRATALARDMVTRYGMSRRLGPVCYESDGEVFIGRDYEKTKAYSEQVAGSIDAEVQELMESAYARCTQILQAHRAQLEAVTQYLLDHETMDRAQFEAVMAREPATQEGD